MLCSVCSCSKGLLILDLQEAVRLSSKADTVSGLEDLGSSGHWTALDEFSQKMLQKVLHLLTVVNFRNLPYLPD